MHTVLTPAVLQRGPHPNCDHATLQSVEWHKRSLGLSLARDMWVPGGHHHPSIKCPLDDSVNLNKSNVFLVVIHFGRIFLLLKASGQRHPVALVQKGCRSVPRWTARLSRSKRPTFLGVGMDFGYLFAVQPPRNCKQLLLALLAVSRTL